MDKNNASLPYVDNTKAVLVTVAINLGVVFLFHWPGGVSYRDVLWDSLICTVLTVVIDLWIVFFRLKKMRAEGSMPAHVLVSRLMQHLPHNPFALGTMYIAAFGVVTIGVNAAILRFFGMQALAFAPWLVYKLIYSTILSAKIIEFCIFRYVQPDWAQAEGAEAGANARQSMTPVKNPLPKVGVFKEMLGSIIGNIGINILFGSVLGSINLREDGAVVILPTPVESMPITGLVFGLIVGVLVTNGVVKAMNASIAASRPVVQETAVADAWLAWMPIRRGSLICLTSICLMIFSAVVLRAALTLFGITILNFYQFVVFITVYAALVSKPLSFVLAKRCMQPDYIRYALEKAKMTQKG